MGNTHSLRPQDVVARAVHGAVSLGGGQVAAQILNIGGAILLARLLAPAEFGLVAIFTFLLAFLTLAGDLGLGMSLVRRPAEPSDADYRAVSSFQQAAALGIALAACLATPWVVRAYGFTGRERWLLPAMALAILADSVRFLPLARLERQLRFERVGIVEIAQAIVFNAVLLSLALRGWQATSFPVAVIARSMTGAMFANLLGPRLSGWAWSWPTVRGYLALGIPFQGINLLWVLRTSVIPVLVGLMLGPSSVGRLQWAAMVGGFPLTGLILLRRLYVGSFARLQEHPLELARFVRHLLSATHGVVAPIAVVTLVLIDPIVRIVFGAAWLSAVPLFYVLWAACLVTPTVEPLAGLLHALGRSREVFRATLAAVLASWILGVPLALMAGEMGAAVASLAVHAAGLPVWRMARRAVDVSVLKSAALPWMAAAVAGVAAWLWHAVNPIVTIWQLLACGAAVSVLYLACLAAGGFSLFGPAREALAPYVWRRSPALRGTGR